MFSYINMLFKWLHIHLEKLQHLCQNQLLVIMAQECTSINPFGKVILQFSLEINIQDYQILLYITLVEY